MKPLLRQPRFWLLSVAALALAAGTFSLGQWQLRRAAQKQALQAAIEDQARQPVLDVQTLLAVKDSVGAVHRPATLKGVWQTEHTVFLDNRPMGGKSGFVAVTPLRLEGSGQAVLVQRGWVQRDFMDRAHVPAITTPAGLVTVHGRIAPPPSKLYEFKGMDSGPIRQNIDMAIFGGEIGLPLLTLSMLQTDPASEGLLRDWSAPNLGVDKHYGYAFQWFGLCALVLGLYVWFQVITPLRKSLRFSTWATGLKSSKRRDTK